MNKALTCIISWTKPGNISPSKKIQKQKKTKQKFIDCICVET